MGDCDKSESRIEFIEVGPLFQGILIHPKFVCKTISEVLIPGTCVLSSKNTSSSHAHLSRLTSWWWVLSWHHEQEQPFYSSCLRVCGGCVSRTTTPLLLCCTRKDREKLPRLPVGESVRTIVGSCWKPCTISLALE